MQNHVCREISALDIPIIKIVVATRIDEKSFETETALGMSLVPFKRLPFIKVRLFANNKSGLPALYNDAIDESMDDSSILLFVHDDVYICDFFWFNQIINGLRRFDIIGLAGNKRRIKKQPSWLFINDKFTPDKAENLSGVVGHGKGIPDYKLSFFGQSGQAVKLLDGLFIACYSETLLSNNIKFDECFDFHFYDLDFCRQAEEKGLKMGTLPISVVHESGGAFGKDAWKIGYSKYLKKWGD